MRIDQWEWSIRVSIHLMYSELGKCKCTSFLVCLWKKISYFVQNEHCTNCTLLVPIFRILQIHAYALETHLLFLPFLPSPGQKGTAVTATRATASTTNCFISDYKVWKLQRFFSSSTLSSSSYSSLKSQNSATFSTTIILFKIILRLK